MYPFSVNVLENVNVIVETASVTSVYSLEADSLQFFMEMLNEMADIRVGSNGLHRFAGFKQHGS
jgi:hypothetical protein